MRIIWLLLAALLISSAVCDITGARSAAGWLLGAALIVAAFALAGGEQNA